MIDILVGLVWRNTKLASASFAEKQFWTETGWIYLVDQNEEIGVDPLDLGVSQEGLEVGIIIEFLEQ